MTLIYEVHFWTDPPQVSRFENKDDAIQQAKHFCSVDQSEGKLVEVVEVDEDEEERRSIPQVVFTRRG